MTNIPGLDIYYQYQKVTDAQAISDAGHQFAYTKGCDGHVGVVDPNRAIAYLRNLRDAGIAVGFYHFAQVNSSNAAEQAQRFVNTVLHEPHDLVPMLDMESDAGPGFPYTQWCQQWIDEYRRLTGKRTVLLYSSRYWFTSGRINPDAFDADVWLWPAAYTSYQADFNALGWEHPQIAIYQYSDKGSVPGIQGGVDLDIAVVPLETISYATTVTSPVTEEDFMATMSDAEKALLLEAASSVLFGVEGQRTAGPLAAAVDNVQHVLTDPIASGVPGSTVQFSPRDAWRNADAYGYGNQQLLSALGGSGPVDVNALAAALSDKLAPAEVAALAKQLAKP